jgi:hypothetical protein
VDNRVDASSPLAQTRIMRKVDGSTVAFVETLVFIAGDTGRLIPVALEMLRSPWGSHEGGWWSHASTTFVVAPPSPSMDVDFSFDFRPVYLVVPRWVRALAGGLVGTYWGVVGAALGVVVGAAALPPAFSPTLIRVAIGKSKPIAGREGLRLPAILSRDFSGPAELTVDRRPDGIELRSAWLDVRCHMLLPPGFAARFHQWRERGALLAFKTECERRAAGAGATVAGGSSQ